MARIYGKLDEWELWVPEDERDLFEDDPDKALTMELRHLSRKELERYANEREKSLKRRSRKSNEDLARAFVTENVRNVTNYVMAGEPIRSGDDLFENGEPSLIAEVVQALTDRGKIDEGLGKNLNGLSDTPSRDQSSKSGDVVGAIPQ